MTPDLKALIARLRGGDTMSMRPGADALEALVAERDRLIDAQDAKFDTAHDEMIETERQLEETESRAQAAEAEVERLRAELNRPVKIDEVRLSVGEWILLPEDILRGVNTELLRLARAALRPAQETADD